MSITDILLVVFIVVDLIVLYRYVKLLRYVVHHDRIQAATLVNQDWSVLSVGITDPVIEAAWLKAAQKMFFTFAKKNHDYGSDNLARGGVMGIILRIVDKVSRIWELAGPNKNVRSEISTEPTEDTFLDLANYSICGYIMTDGRWPEVKDNLLSTDDVIISYLSEVVTGLSSDTRNRLLSIIYAAEIAGDLGAVLES